MEAKPVVETLAHTYQRIEAETLKDTQIEVETEALLDVLAHTLEIKADNFLLDSGWCVHKGTCQRDALQPSRGGNRNTCRHSARFGS